MPSSTSKMETAKLLWKRVSTLSRADTGVQWKKRIFFVPKKRKKTENFAQEKTENGPNSAGGLGGTVSKLSIFQAFEGI